jgi:hypothetical protein
VVHGERPDQGGLPGAAAQQHQRLGLAVEDHADDPALERFELQADGGRERVEPAHAGADGDGVGAALDGGSGHDYGTGVPLPA